MALPVLAIAGPIIDIARTWLNGRVETTKEKAAARVEIAKAKTKTALAIQQKVAEGDISWELIQAQNAGKSLKDEWLTLLISIPLILAFCGDWGRNVVSEGFAALELMPEWYRWAVGVVFGAAFGVKTAAKGVKWWADRVG